jgi:copper chaperone CopZ
MEQTQKYTLFVHGMHCKSCVVLTETELIEHPSVSSAKSSLHTKTVEICGDFSGKPLEEIAKELTSLCSWHAL